MNSLHRVPSFVEWAFGAEFAAKLDAIGPARPPAPKADPRESWPAWTDADTWELGPEPEDTRDHARPPGPSAVDAAFHLGFTLGLDREDVSDPTDVPPAEVSAFRAGREAGRREWDRRLDEMFGSREWAEFSDGISDQDVYRPGAVS